MGLNIMEPLWLHRPTGIFVHLYIWGGNADDHHLGGFFFLVVGFCFLYLLFFLA